MTYVKSKNSVANITENHASVWVRYVDYTCYVANNSTVFRQHSPLQWLRSVLSHVSGDLYVCHLVSTTRRHESCTVQVRKREATYNSLNWWNLLGCFDRSYFIWHQIPRDIHDLPFGTKRDNLCEPKSNPRSGHFPV